MERCTKTIRDLFPDTIYDITENKYDILGDCIQVPGYTRACYVKLNSDNTCCVTFKNDIGNLIFVTHENKDFIPIEKIKYVVNKYLLF